MSGSATPGRHHRLFRPKLWLIRSEADYPSKSERQEPSRANSNSAADCSSLRLHFVEPTLFVVHEAERIVERDFDVVVNVSS